MAAMKPRTGDGPMEVTKEARSLVMRIPLEGGGTRIQQKAGNKAALGHVKFDFVNKEAAFRRTFKELAKVFLVGLSRPGNRTTTPLNLYEGISVGAAMALQKVPHLDTKGLNKWLNSPILRKFTTGATNSRSAVAGRIEFCRDRFLGKPYVESVKD